LLGYLIGWLLVCGCGVPVVLVLYAIGLRLACYAAGADVPGFVKAFAVGAFSLVMLLAAHILGVVFLGVGPLGGDEGEDTLSLRLIEIGACAVGFTLLYVPVLDVTPRQSVRITLMQLVYLALFVSGWLLFGLLR
jgi:hypothetical protein